MIRVTTEFGGTYAGVPYFCNMYWDDVTQAAADAATAAVNAFWEAIDAYIAVDLTWNVNDEAEIVNVTTGQTTGIFSVNGLAGSGDATGDVLPPNTQGLIRWRTGVFVGGREVRGRTFLPGMTEQYSTGGLPTAELITAVQTAAAGLIAAGGADTNLVLWSPTKGVAPAIISGTIWGKWATLRSRRD